MAKTTTSTSEDIVDFIDSASENLGEKGKDLWYEEMRRRTYFCNYGRNRSI